MSDEFFDRVGTDANPVRPEGATRCPRKMGQIECEMWRWQSQPRSDYVKCLTCDLWVIPDPDAWWRC